MKMNSDSEVSMTNNHKPKAIQKINYEKPAIIHRQQVTEEAVAESSSAAHLRERDRSVFRRVLVTPYYPLPKTKAEPSPPRPSSHGFNPEKLRFEKLK
jgi:hypothetical protein